MAPLTKRRHSTRRGGKRKAAIKLSLPTVTKGKGDEPAHYPHRAYEQDGFLMYRGKKIAKA
ncbi:MAG: 50S ribosomal protein L32 [Patescibacteria group bacterium]|nr:50S ribosomal protein L32 [Patescibacteria group bacterium]